MGRAARQGFETQRAGAAENIGDDGAFGQRRLAVGENVEQRLAHPVAGRADVAALRRLDTPAAEPTGDDAHGVSLSPSTSLPTDSFRAFAGTSRISPGLQLAQVERSVGYTDQAVHRQSDMVEHDTDFAVLALAQAYRIPGVLGRPAFRRCLALDPDRAVADAVDGARPWRGPRASPPGSRHRPAPGSGESTRSWAIPGDGRGRRHW